MSEKWPDEDPKEKLDNKMLIYKFFELDSVVPKVREETMRYISVFKRQYEFPDNLEVMESRDKWCRFVYYS